MRRVEPSNAPQPIDINSLKQEYVDPSEELPPEIRKQFVLRVNPKTKSRQYTKAAKTACMQMWIAGWTLTAISQKTGITASTLSNWSKKWPERKRVNNIPQPIPADKLGGVAPGTAIDALTKVPRPPVPLSKEIFGAVEVLSQKVKQSLGDSDDPVKQAKNVVLAVALEQALGFAKNPPPVEKWSDMSTIFSMIDRFADEVRPKEEEKSNPLAVDVSMLKIRPTKIKDIEAAREKQERDARIASGELDPVEEMPLDPSDPRYEPSFDDIEESGPTTDDTSGEEE